MVLSRHKFCPRKSIRYDFISTIFPKLNATIIKTRTMRLGARLFPTAALIVPITPEMSYCRDGYSAGGVLKAAITVLYDAMLVEELLASRS